MQKNLNINGISYEFCHPEFPEAVQRSVIEFWQDQDAVKRQREMERRAKQLTGVVRNEVQIIGVATVRLQSLPPIEKEVFYYRGFISAQARGHTVGVRLHNLTFDFLQEISLETGLGVGLYYELENEYFEQNTTAYSDRSKHFYLGYTDRGLRQGLRYFAHAEL